MAIKGHERLSGVYSIANSQTGKQYIGSTSLAFCKRWHQHRYLLRNGKHHARKLQHSWNKYGESAFVFSVLLITEPQDAVFYEQLVISALKSHERGVGYNTSPTAQSTAGMKWSDEYRDRKKKYYSSEEVRRKLREQSLRYHSRPGVQAERSLQQREYHNRPEIKAINSETQKRIKNTPEERAANSARQRGRKASPETRRKMSEARNRYLNRVSQEAIVIENDSLQVGAGSE